MQSDPLVLGIDLGTSGARACVADLRGGVHATAATDLPPGWSTRPGLHEQDPASWWSAACAVVRSVTRALGTSANAVRSLTVTSTSGTLLPVDDAGQPVAPAMMYNDLRAADLDLRHVPGEPVNPSHALARLAWCVRTRPAWLPGARRFAHAADWLAGRLTGIFDRSDPSNALKSGYDIERGRWSTERLEALGIPARWLPRVEPTGTAIGGVLPTAADDLGLPRDTTVVNGCTDGVASFLASGASRYGDWNSCLGSTLIVKGRSRSPLRDPAGRFYNHADPDGGFLPGGAGNCGGECLPTVFGSDYASLEERLDPRRFPTGLIVYPLVRVGERLPFLDPRARGFVAGRGGGRLRRYAGYLEGVAGVERWIFDEILSLGGKVNATVFATGGGVVSPLWMRIRASILERELAVPRYTDSAFGACIVAARRLFGSMSEAAGAMVRIERRCDPDPAWVGAYGDYADRLREACRNRGLRIRAAIRSDRPA